MHRALLDLATRVMRIWDSRARVAEAARSDSSRALDTQLAQADFEVQSLQAEYGHCLWLVEIASFWNLLEVAVADWKNLSFKECGRRIEWCNSLRRRWRSTLAMWERWDAAERFGLGVRRESNVIAQARQVVYACGQVQQSLLAVKAVLAMRHNGQAGNGARLTACPAEPYSKRVGIVTDLARQMMLLRTRLDCLGEE